MANRRTDEEILAELERRQAQLAAQEKGVRSRIRKKERARDTRRKVLLGSFILQRLETEPKRFARLEAILRDELGGFLKPADRDLFPDILDLDEPQDGGGEAADAALEIGEILSRLGAERKRCTYRAVGMALGISTAEVGPLLGERTPETSWVVSAKTGRPAGYSPGQVHPELELHPEVISDPEELRALCRSGG